MSFLLGFYRNSAANCIKSIIKLVELNPKANYLDCGCGDGSCTLEIANKIGTSHIHGIEVIKAAADKAKARRIAIDGSDLNRKFPYKNDYFDIITASQVIEHLVGTDNLVKEIHRTLKTGGYAIISTNNLASWHNLAALLLGKQPFPSDVSNDNHSIGKLFPLFGEGPGANSHLRIFTYSSLKSIFEHYGFRVEKIVGIGYYPLPTSLASLFCKIDKRHSAYLTIKVRKI